MLYFLEKVDWAQKRVESRLEPHQCATIVRIITEETPNQLKMSFVLGQELQSVI